MSFVPAFFDFKCPKCGTPSNMTDKEKEANQRVCDATMAMAKAMNEREKENEM